MTRGQKARERANHLDSVSLRCGCIERGGMCGWCESRYKRSARLHKVADDESKRTRRSR